jgi:hypothetical protein
MKRDMLTVVDARPPNFDKIVAVLPDAAQSGVMFAYDGKVYWPGGKGPLTRELNDHEAVHLERQKHQGLDSWWEQYLTDVNFRYNEELLAHRAEYRTFCKRHINPIKRHQFLRQIAKRLASSLYAAGLTDERAAIEIQFGDAA